MFRQCYTVDQNLGIDQITYIGYGGNCDEDSSPGTTVFNYDFNTSVPTVNSGYSMGNGAYYFRLDNDLIINSMTAVTGRRYLISIERTLTSQYGGNTYTARSNNTYQSCSMLRPIRSTKAGIPDEPIIFGGDTFVNLWDSCRWAKNWGNSGRGIAAQKLSSTMFIPISTPINTGLQHGKHMNKDFVAASDTIEFIETYFYNK